MEGISALTVGGCIGVASMRVFAGGSAARSRGRLTAFARDARGRVTTIAEFAPRPVAGVRSTTRRSGPARSRRRSRFGRRRRGADRGVRSRARLRRRRGRAIRGSRSWGRVRRASGPRGRPASGRPRADCSTGSVRRPLLRRGRLRRGGGPGLAMIGAGREGKAGQMAPAEGTGHQGGQPSCDQRGGEDDHRPNQNVAPSTVGDEHGTLSRPRGRAGSLDRARVCCVCLHIDPTWAGPRSQALYRGPSWVRQRPRSARADRPQAPRARPRARSCGESQSAGSCPTGGRMHRRPAR
jgi:hypothetical protein